MKKQLKRIGALVLSGVLALGMSNAIYAATALDGGIEGDTDDTASVQYFLSILAYYRAIIADFAVKSLQNNPESV